MEDPGFYGYPSDEYESYIQTVNPVTLPPASAYFLHFNHSAAFEIGGNYDGGVVEYSLDWGTWTDISALYEVGQNYNGVIIDGSTYPSPLVGRNSFTQETHGYVSTRYNLASLAGHNVRFRWVIGSDDAFFNMGWFLDDIAIYTCSPVPAIAVEGPGATPIAQNSMYDMGATTLGSPINHSITIRNTGSAVLNLLTSAPGVTGEYGDQTTEFTVSNFSATSVAPGSTATFTLTCNPSGAVAVANGQVSFNHNDATQNPFVFDVTCTVPVPMIQLETTEGYWVSYGDSYYLGQTPLGVPRSQTIVVKNIGTSDLHLLDNAPTVTGEFASTSFGSTTVQPGGSTTFTLTCTPTAPGYTNGSVSFGNDDADENPFVFDVSCLGSVPDIEVTGTGSVPIADGGTYDMGTTTMGTPISKTINVVNVGTGTVYLSNPTTTGEFAAGPFSFGSTASFTLTCNATVVGAPVTGTVSFENTDNDENPFDFTVTCTVNPTAPEAAVVVQMEGDSIADEGSYSMGTTVVGAPLTRTIRVLNNGNAPLNLVDNSPAITGDFSVGAFSSTSVAPAGAATFTLTCNANASGVASGTVSFANSDSDENPYNFTVTCNVVSLCPDPANSPINYLFNDNLEGGAGNFTVAITVNPYGMSPSSAWYIRSDYASSGTNALYGINHPRQKGYIEGYKYQSNVAMTNPVTLPAGSTYYLFFNHHFELEPDDGGVLEYSRNSGAWTDAASLFEAGQNYNGVTGYYNPLGPRSTFTGEGGGYVFSRYNLSSLAGGSVRFRWVIGADMYGYDWGWFLDDIKVYACAAPPAAPTTLSAVTASDSQINLSWVDNSADESTFRVERSANGATGWTEINTVAANQTSYQDTGLACGVYYYRVRAHRSSDGAYSSYSNVASAPTTACPPPAAPTSLTATSASQTQINLAWADNSGDETTFRIERSPDGSSGWTEISAIAANQISYQNTGLTCNTAYHYRVRAYRSGDGLYSDYSNVANTTTSACPPAAPSALSATTISQSQIDLEWTDNASDETAFFVEVSSNGTSGWITYEMPADTTGVHQTGMACNTVYYHRVRAYRSSDGLYSSYSNMASAKTTTCPPSAPTLLSTVTISETRIDLMWVDNSISETAYRIERSPDGIAGWSEIGSVPTNQSGYQDTGVTCGATYFYRVRAYRSTDDSYSNYSNTASAVTPVCTITAPSGLIASGVSQTQINLGWSDHSPDETAFRIERSPDGSTGWSEINTVGANQTGYQDTSVVCGTTYFYRVRAYRSGDSAHSAYSNTASASTTACPPPTAPSGLTASGVSQTQIDLSWIDNSSNETGFQIERSPNGINGWTEIGSAAAGEALYHDMDVTCATPYFYRVRAYRSTDSQYSGYSNTAHASTMVCPPPADPGDLTAVGASQTQIDLTWTDHSSDETSFRVERSPDGTNGWLEIGATAADVTAYSDAGLTCETMVYYRVRAYRSTDSQYSDYSNTDNAVTAICPPAAPTGLVASGVSQTQIDLSWSDNSGDETDFRIERSSNGTSGWTEIGTAAANATTFSDVDLTCSTTFYYRVRAFRSTDSQYSTYSGVAGAMTVLCPPPTAPGGLVATTVSQNQIDLTWADNSLDETGFRIERSPDGVGGWAEIGTVTADQTSYQSTGLLCETTYFYRVRAYRSSDGVYSDYSTAASASTNACNAFCSTVTQIPRYECDALLALYESTGGAGWTRISNWLTTTTPCSWEGVYCATGHVIRLILNQNNLTGSLPPEIGNFPELLTLDLYNNALTGLLPPELGNLVKLNRLVFYNNQFSGGIPPEIGNLVNVDDFNLQLCGLSGPLPPEIGNMTKVTNLGLSENHLTGPLPSTLGNMTSLRELHLGKNAITGPIPPELFSLPNLGVIDLENNALEGEIPAEIVASSLVEIFVNYNRLTASDPAVIAWLDAYAGNWANTQTVAPTGIAADVISNTDILVEWTPIPYVGDGGYYEVGYSTTSGGPYTSGCITIDKSEDHCTVTGLVTETSYYLAVRTFTPAHGDQQNDLWSAFSPELFVTTPYLARPVLQSPAYSTITSNNRPTLVWNSVDGADQYIVQVDDSPDFIGPLVVDETLSQTSYAFATTLPDGGTYYWRIEALDSAVGKGSPWSAVWSFQVDITRLRAPLLALPKDRSNTPDQTPTLSWGAVSGAKAYQVQWSSDPLLAGAPEVQVTTLTHTVPEQPYGVYFWRVRARSPPTSRPPRCHAASISGTCARSTRPAMRPRGARPARSRSWRA